MSDERPLRDLVPEAIAALSAYTVPAEPAEVKLDANESPWPLPDDARARLLDHLARIPLHRYPDPRASALRAALAARVGGPPEGLVVGSGSDEIIALLVSTFARPRAGRARAVVLIPSPSFVMYRIAALAHGLEPVEVPLGPRFELDVPAMRAALARHRPSLLFLASPNNPTGNTFEDPAVDALIEAAEGETLVVIDEAYAAFAGRSRTELCDRHRHVGVLGTLSKVGLAAARIGWARLHPALATEVDKVRPPFNLNAFSQEVGRLALTELAPILDAQVADIVRERARLETALAAHPRLSPCPSEANFVLVHVDGSDGGAATLVRALRAEGIAIRGFAGHGAPLDAHVRITVGTPRENDRLIETLYKL